MRSLLSSILGFGILLAVISPSPADAARATLQASAVAAPDRYGALAAKEVLQTGGNAADAAVATAFALAVTYPEAGNLGGGGFMTLWMSGKPYFLDYRETAPAQATAGMHLGPDGQPVADKALVGELASGVPGTVRGMPTLHARSAKLRKLRFHRQLLPENTVFSEPFALFPPAPEKAVTARRYRVEAQDFNGDIEAIQVVGDMPHPGADPVHVAS